VNSLKETNVMESTDRTKRMFQIEHIERKLL